MRYGSLLFFFFLLSCVSTEEKPVINRTLEELEKYVVKRTLEELRNEFTHDLEKADLYYRDKFVEVTGVLLVVNFDPSFQRRRGSLGVASLEIGD